MKLFSYSTQLSTKFILLINVKMPTIVVGILTFISMINTTSERLKARNFFICRYFSVYEQLKFRTQLSWAWKKFYNLGAWSWRCGTFEKRCSLLLAVYLPWTDIEDNPCALNNFNTLWDSLTFLSFFLNFDGGWDCAKTNFSDNFHIMFLVKNNVHSKKFFLHWFGWIFSKFCDYKRTNIYYITILTKNSFSIGLGVFFQNFLITKVLIYITPPY